MLFTLVLVVLVGPIWLVDYVPLVDYPNHLARVALTLAWSHDENVQKLFSLVWIPVPNVAIDLVMLLIIKVVSIEVAGKLFLTILVILFALGTHLVGTAVSKTTPPWMALVAAFLIYNSTFIYGFLNYNFGVALFLLTFGLWLRWHDSGFSVVRWAIIAMLTFFTYLSHLSGFLFLWIGCGWMVTYDIFFRGGLFIELKREGFGAAFRKSIVELTPLLPTLVGLLAYMRGSGAVGSIVFNSLYGKAAALVGPIRTYNMKFDIVFFGITGIAAVILFLSAKNSTQRKLLTLGIVFFIGFLVCPWALFTNSSADARFVIPAFFCAFVSIPLVGNKSVQRLTFSILLALNVYRIVTILAEWKVESSTISDIVVTLNKIPSNSRIYPHFPTPQGSEDERKKIMALEHVVHYATLQRGTVAASLLALPAQNALVWKAPADIQFHNEVVDYNVIRANGYDYVWAYGPTANAAARAAGLTSVESSNEFTLWKIF